MAAPRARRKPNAARAPASIVWVAKVHTAAMAGAISGQAKAPSATKRSPLMMGLAWIQFQARRIVPTMKPRPQATMPAK